MSEWKKVRLGEVVEFNPRESIKKGVVAKKVAMDRLVPFCREISGYEQEPFAGGSKFRNGDTLVARITPCLENGKTAYVSVLDKGEVGFGSTEYIVLRSREGVTNDRYVYYLATSPWFRGIAIQSMVGSSGRQRVQQDVLEHLEVRLPSLGEQERIAGVLGALDDKIELNNRINRNLEQQAEALFRRWFVGKEFDKVSLDSFGKIICGKTPPKSNNEYFGGDVPFIKIPDMHDKVYTISTQDTLTVLGSNYQANKILPPYSILVSCIATVGLVSMNTVNSHSNQQINAIIPHNHYCRFFLYLKMKTMCDDLQLLASGGSATLNLSTGQFSKIIIDKPNDDILVQFDLLVSPIFNQIEINTKQNMCLAQLRNTLLPQLMNNQLKI